MKENYLKVNYSTRTQNKAYDERLLSYLLKCADARHRAGTVLDVACGTGGFRPTFRRLGFEYHGVDIDSVCPDLGISRVDVGNECLPFPDASFDLVFFKMGIEHLNIREIGYSLAEIKRVVKPGCPLIIITPNWLWTYDIFYNEYTHQTPFTPSSLRTAIEMSGLTCKISRSLIQLPIVWKWPWMKYVCDVASLLYPVLPSVKFIRYAKERVVFCLATK